MISFVELPRDVIAQVLRNTFTFFDELSPTYEDVKDLIDKAVQVIDTNVNARCREGSCDISMSDFTLALEAKSLDFVAREFLYLLVGILSFGTPQEKYVKHCSIRVIFLSNNSREWLKNQLIYRGIEAEKAEKIAEWTIRADCVYRVEMEESAPQWLKDGGLIVLQVLKKFICQELDAAGTPIVCQIS
ncbi:hypothetical protein VB715_11135 [Crocosphaera sp. UHCC 0190]|uniref:hypothetical protein n=1 Tax=Crocosphaera sp. UHCC 0190 TaxID=3110246 RepID=UPI002B1EE235|nr:hypothetical protein [Crocosphaera sp. UHCC 0190]MEA5510317.1 hypothetical protein [Crocosphaera sp. UHCC 0190]